MTLTLTRIDNNTTRAEAEDVGLSEQIDNRVLGRRVIKIMAEIHAMHNRVTQKEITPEIRSCIDFFNSRMEQVVLRYEDRDEFVNLHSFKSAKIILTKSIGEWNAERVIYDFLDEHFPNAKNMVGGDTIADTQRSPGSELANNQQQ